MLPPGIACAYVRDLLRKGLYGLYGNHVFHCQKFFFFFIIEELHAILLLNTIKLFILLKNVPI